MYKVKLTLAAPPGSEHRGGSPDRTLGFAMSCGTTLGLDCMSAMTIDDAEEVACAVIGVVVCQDPSGTY